MTQTRDVKLPADLCAAAEQKFGPSFGGVEDLLSFVLQALLQDPGSELDKAEREFVEKRLRELGYL
ncbi:MAG TPA: hypothetical protein VMH04_08625 [Candidatus Solibacter sp.]|jgi:hypothetical protein|nr:hypothetical protein [Candidatus Solibacter sp.]